MSRPRSIIPVLSTIALTLVSSWTLAGDLLGVAEPARESSLSPQISRQFELEPDGPTPPIASALRERSYALLKAAAVSPLVNVGSDSRSFRTFGELQFRDNQPLVNRLKRVQAWPLFTIWDSRAATLYVGMNRDGEPGVHLRQKRQDRGSLVSPRRVLIASSL